CFNIRFKRVLDMAVARPTISAMNPAINKAFMNINPLSPLKIFAAGLCIALMPAFAFGQSASFPSQPYSWKSVVMKGGGFIDGIVFNTAQPGLAYCRTDVGSSYRGDNEG